MLTRKHRCGWFSRFSRVGVSREAMQSFLPGRRFSESLSRCRRNRSSIEPTRRRNGAVDWRVYRDLGEDARFVERFDANSYIVLSMALDLFDLGSTPDELAYVPSNAAVVAR